MLLHPRFVCSACIRIRAATTGVCIDPVIYGSPYYTRPLQSPLTCKHETRSSWHCTVYDNTTRELYNLLQQRRYPLHTCNPALSGDLTVSGIHDFHGIKYAVVCAHEGTQIESPIDSNGSFESLMLILPVILCALERWEFEEWIV